MLIDSCIFIEIAKKQENAQSCQDLLDAIWEEIIPEDVYITEFSLRAIESMLAGRANECLREILLLIHEGKIKVYRGSAKRDLGTLSILKDIGLDFDDGVQFTATISLDTYLVTYDKHFKKTHLQTKTPDEVLKDILV